MILPGTEEADDIYRFWSPVSGCTDLKTLLERSVEPFNLANSTADSEILGQMR